MIRFFSLLLLILWSNFASAKFSPLEIHEMIVAADKIVHGKIVDLDATHFYFEVEGSPTNDSGVLKVRRFEDWACASRWTFYKKGQKLLLFLTSWEGELMPMGGGDEGELPIKGESVYINAMSLGFFINGNPGGGKKRVQTFPSKSYELHGDSYYGSQTKLNEFLKNVTSIRQCLKAELGKYKRIISISVRCDIAQINSEDAASLLLRAVVKRVREKYK